MMIFLQSSFHFSCKSFIADSVPFEKEFPNVVCEYSNVFLKNLIGLPPHRVIEFTIELQPGTHPISMPPYRLTPAKIDELNR